MLFCTEVGDECEKHSLTNYLLSVRNGCQVKHAEHCCVERCMRIHSGGQLCKSAEKQAHGAQKLLSALLPECREQWLEAARRAFAELDAGAAGVLRSGQLLELLRRKLPAVEVEYAVEDALLQAGHAGQLSPFADL